MPTHLRIADHPRAAAGVRRMRGGAGLAGFVLGALLAHRAGLPGFDVLARALVCGIAAHCVGWVFAVTYWRGAMLAELEAVRARRERAMAERADRVLRDAAAAGGGAPGTATVTR